MKKVQLVAYEKIPGADSFKSLHALNGIFNSPILTYDDNIDNNTIFHELLNMFDFEISRLCNPVIHLKTIEK